MSHSLLPYASITKKITMSVSGLFLVLYLIIHLSLNLLLLVNDGGILFGEAAEFMRTNIFINIMEFVLFGSIILHFFLGMLLHGENKKARPVQYEIASKANTSTGAKYMAHTGIVILIFLIIHLINFYFVKLGWVSPPEGIYDAHDFYSMAILLFKSPTYSIIYIISMLALGFHLNHAVQSGLQTLGINHPKYTPRIKKASTIYAIIITTGFTIIPLYFLLNS